METGKSNVKGSVISCNSIARFKLIMIIMVIKTM